MHNTTRGNSVDNERPVEGLLSDPAWVAGERGLLIALGRTRFGRTQEQAEDLAQQALLRAWEARQTYVGPARTVRPWLVQLWRRHTIDVLRRERLVGWLSLDGVLDHSYQAGVDSEEAPDSGVLANRLQRALADQAPTDPAGSSVEAACCQHETAAACARLVSAALATLLPHYAALLRQLYLAEGGVMTYPTLAVQCGETLQTVKARRHRAARRFRAAWAAVAPVEEWPWLPS